MTDETQRIASLEARMDSVEMQTNRNTSAIEKLNEAITVVRETLARVATKDDIIALSHTITEQHSQELRDAHNSIPSKVAMVVGVLMAVISFSTFLLAHHGT